ETASVEVSRGQVELIDNQGRRVFVNAGEEGWVHGGAHPGSGQAPHLAEALAWSESSFGEVEPAARGRGLGQLVSKKPGTEGELEGAVTLTSHKVNVRI